MQGRKVRLAISGRFLLLFGLLLASLVHAEQDFDFVLDSRQGKVDSRDYRGQLLVLYFGYTSCPDICPMTLWALGQALDQLDDAARRRVHPFLVTLDPERDDAERLHAYVQAIHSDLRGLTGSVGQIKAMADRYEVVYRKVELPGSALEYAIEHSGYLYILDAGGQIAAWVPHGTPAEDIAGALRTLLARTPGQSDGDR